MTTEPTPLQERIERILAEHPGDGVERCRDCDEGLAEDAWNMAPDGHAEQACPNGHWNAITPKENPR